MNMILTQKGVLIMGDVWDYKLRKMDIAWELAQRTIPKTPAETGGWGEGNFLKRSEDMLKQANDIVNTIFSDDKPSGALPTSASRR